MKRIVINRRRLLRRLAAGLLLAIFLMGAARAGLEVYASYQLRAADEAIGRQNYAQARVHLERALPARRKSAHVQFVLARVCRRNGDLEAARRHLDRCRELGDGSSDDYRLERLLLDAQEDGSDEQLETLNNFLRANRPEAPLVLETLCLTMFRRQILGPMLAYANQWAGAEPGNVQARFFQGICNVQLGLLPDAVEAFRAALERDPARDDIRLMLASCLVDSGQYDEPASLAEAMLTRLPKSVAVRLVLAKARGGLGDQEQEQAILDEMLRSGVKDPDVLAERGRLALRLGHPAHAEVWLRQALEGSPGDLAASHLLVSCLHALDKTHEANELAAKLKRREEAHTRISAILTEDLMKGPPRPALCQELGELFLETGDDGQAVYWFYRALRLDPTYAPAHKSLAAYWERAGDAKRVEFHKAMGQPRDKSP